MIIIAEIAQKNAEQDTCRKYVGKKGRKESIVWMLKAQGMWCEFLFQTGAVFREVDKAEHVNKSHFFTKLNLLLQTKTSEKLKQ